MSRLLAYLHLLAAPQLKISGVGTVARLGKQPGICVGWIPVGGEEQEHLLSKGRKFTLFLVKAEMAERKEEKRVPTHQKHRAPSLLLHSKFPASFSPKRFS